MSKQTERDDLTDILHGAGAYCGSCDYEDGACNDCIEILGEYAHAILAAGYWKPQQAATVEELDALGRGVAVLDAMRRVWTNDGDSLAQWGCVNHDEYPQSLVWRGSADIALPALIFYSPEK